MGTTNPCPKRCLSINTIVVGLLLVAATVNAEAACRKGCPQSDNGILKYVPGNVYEYNFDSVLTVDLSTTTSGEKDDTSLKVQGTTKLFAEGNCGYTLQLNAVKVTATKESIEKKILQSIQKPVHFTMVGGKVEPEICIDADDAVYALNIKRAIISLLSSNTNSDSIDIDVFGKCPTHTSVSKVGGAEIVTKVRNLNSCAYREKINGGVVHGVVNDNAGVKSTLLLQADYSKETKVEHGVVANAHLFEEYKFAGAPKTGTPGIVRAKVVTTLKVKNAAGAPANAPPTGTHSASIVFQKPDTLTTKNIAALKTAISEVVQMLENYVQKDSAKHFTDLIRLMRNADDDTLLELAAFPHPNKVLARKVYLDALFRTGTEESAKAIIKQVGKLDKKAKAIALLSLRTVQTVDKELLQQATALLNANAGKEVYLAVGDIVSKYCQQNDCEQSDIEQVSKKFTDLLKGCKAANKKEEDRIVYVLRGISNMHHIASSVAPILSECAAIGHSTRVRVAALQAFSAASCVPALQQKALELLRDRNEDSEVRIEAYLAAVNCPNAELANQIADIVNSETVYQVGGFIASHLKAIRDSTDVTHEQQRYFLGNIRVTKQFPKDDRRYSYNSEFSYKLEALGLGASTDYKLIYSQNGFLPRSARLNVSTEIFGTNFNVFEASIRQENLENVLEYYVGPKGILNKDFHEIMKVIEGGVPGGRARRSIADETNKVAHKYKSYGNKHAQDLNLDIALKLFGSEIMFLSLGDNIPSTLDDIIKHASFAFDEVKKELSAFNKEFNMHTLFLDGDIVYPTGVGLPLELTAHGFAANKLELGINIDVDAILENSWQQSKYRVKVVPSIDVNAYVKLGFNAHVLSTGLRVSSNLHSATGSDVNFAFTSECSGFNIDIELPREKLELLDVSITTDFFVAEQDKPIKSIAVGNSQEAQPTEMCFNQLDALGFTYCISSTIPESNTGAVIGPEQLAQPIAISMYISSERKFKLKGCHVPKNEQGSQQWKLDFSTPGSKENHDTALIFEVGAKTRTYTRVAFINPQYNFAVEAGLNNDNKELVLYAQYEFNDQVKKNRIGFVKNGNEYKPIIELQDKNGVVSDIDGYRADGKIVVEKKGDRENSYKFQNFEIINPQNERIVVNGFADVGPANLNSVLSILVGQEAYAVKSHLQTQGGDYAVGLFINNEKTPDQTIGGSVNVKVADRDVALHIVGNVLTWQLNLKNALQYQIEEGSNDITSSSFNNEVTILHKKNVALSVTVKGSTEGKNKLDVAVDVVRAKKHASVSVKYSGKQKSEHDYLLEVNGKLNKHFVSLMARCDLNGNHFVVDNVLTTSWGTALSAKGELGQRFTPQDVHIDLQGSVLLNSKDTASQWVLKVIGSPDKTNSEFKIIRDNAELIKYNAETQHPQDKITSGKVHLTVKSVLTVNGDFKLLKNGKGEITANIETQKTEPKHNIDVNAKFHVQAPKYDVDVTATIDADKKIVIKTENTVEKTKIASKNSVELGDKKVSLDFNGLVKGEWRLNGEVQGDFVLTAPDGRVIDGKLNRKFTTNPKTGISHGNMEVQFNEQLPNGGQKRSLDFNAKIERFSVKGKEFSVEHNLVYTNFEGQKLITYNNYKNLPKTATTRLFDIDFKANGELLESPVELAIVIDDYNKEQATYRVTGKYGDIVSGNFNGNYLVKVRGESPSKFEIQGNLQLPKTSIKSIDIQSRGKYSKPDSEAGGPYVLELHVDERFGNGEFVQLNTVWKGSKQQGLYNFAYENKHMKGPLKLEGSWQREKSGSFKDGTGSSKQKFDFKLNYADKYIQTTADLHRPNVDTGSIHYTLDTSFETAKAIDIELHVQKLDVQSYAITVQGKQNGKNYQLDSKIHGTTHKQGLDVHLTLPNGTPVVIVGIVEHLGERKAKFVLEVENLGDLDFKAGAESAYKSIEDAYILANWNSAKLNLDHYELEVRFEGKTMTLNLKNAQGVYCAGTATFAMKKEQQKSIVEGQGQVQYKGKSQNMNFRLTHQKYIENTDKEQGFSYVFNGNFGPKNAIATLKITNKDFNVKLASCEDKQQCSNVQVQSTVNVEDVDAATHSLLVLIDLRELGYPYEFDLQSKTTTHGHKLQYSLDSTIVSNNNLKYQLLAQVLPTNSKVQVKLPHREILLETQHQYPQQGTIFGHYENSIAFYIDKTNKPNDVTRLTTSTVISGVEHIALNAKGEARFEHPTIRPLTISGRFDVNRQKQIADAEITLDIFRTPEQQVIATSRIQNIVPEHGFNITTNHGVRSNGLGFLYEVSAHTALNTERQEFSLGAEGHTGSLDLKSSAYIYGNKEHIEVLLYGLNEPIVQFSGGYDSQKHTAKIDSKFQILEQKPIEFAAELQATSAKFSVKRQNLFDVQGGLTLGKEANVQINSPQKQVFHGHINLGSANFLQTKYQTNEEDIKAFLDHVDAEVRKDISATNSKIIARYEKLRSAVDQQVQLAKDSVPDFSQLIQSHQDSINDIVKELENDPALKQLSESFHQIYANIAKIAGNVAKISAESYEKIHKSFLVIYEKLELILRDTLIPAWEELMVTATKIVGELRIEIINFYTRAFKSLLDVLEQYGDVLKAYGKPISEALKPFHDTTQELLKTVTHVAYELIDELKEFIAKLPTFEAIHAEVNDKLQKLKLLEKTLVFVNDLFDHLHILPQTPETTEFLQKAHEYIEAKLKKQQVNDEKLLEELFKLLVKAARSILEAVKMNAPATPDASAISPYSVSSWFNTLPLAIDAVGKLPALLSFRLSLINYILHEDWQQVFSKENIKSWTQLNEFDLTGHVADGHHIFTFDGQYITFPGSCKYILAQDSVDGNFSVVAHLNNGKLKSVILTDREGSFIEVTDTGVLKVNGNPAEYPQHSENMHVWRKYYTVWLLSEYGVKIMCTTDLKVCHINVDGFYTSKTRGLLGNGNAEPYDDFLQIDGTIAQDYATFGNGYGLGKCTPVANNPALTQPPVQSEICNEIFDLDSPLAIGYLFIDVTPYRQACHQAVAAAPEKDKETTACTIASTYGSAIKLTHNVVLLPPVCLKCAGTAGQRELGQDFTVKIPNTKADIVFVVDVGIPTSVLNNLVSPAITEVRETLKARGFTDAQISVIAFNESQSYPALLTSDNGKINYQGNLAQTVINGPRKFCDYCISQLVSDTKTVDLLEVLERILNNFVPQAEELAYGMAINYPFRAGAAKSIVVVRNTAAEYENLFKFVRAHILGAAVNYDGALLHMLAPVEDLSLEGVPTEKLVGFNARLVATVDGKDAKKRAKLQFKNNLGIDVVLDNGGWVFGTQNFEQLNAQDQKKTLNQVTNSIADTLFKTEIVSECKCLPVYGLHAQHKCVVKSSTFVPNKKVKAA